MIVLACSPSTGIGLQKQSVLLHQAEDALGIDGLASGGSALALEERGDPPAIGGPLVDEVADVGNQIEIAGTALRTALRARAVSPFDDVGSGDLQCGGDGLHGDLPDLASATARSVFLSVRGREPPGLSDILCVGPVDHHAVTNRASNMMANCVFASDHSRGGIFQSAAT